MTSSGHVAEPAVSRYLAECFWPGVRERDVESAAARLDAGIDTRTPSQAVRCEGWILVSADEVVFFLFHAVSDESVRTACEQAAIGAERVIEVRSTVTARA